MHCRSISNRNDFGLICCNAESSRRGTMTGRPLVAAPENVKENGMENVRENLGRVARNVEVWIFGAFAGLVERTETSRAASAARPASQVGVTRETELAQPQAGLAQPMYVVYVTGKRPRLAEKRAARADAG
jgi:hypothetical protein